ncbi:3'-5' exonuclease [Streptomyces sp. NPDC002221]|uniref:3'-5' exonuclease n=1 Tax=Streptomyces sp. NPDC002221 TaxID=3364639 RepID=UPI0036984E6E
MNQPTDMSRSGRPAPDIATVGTTNTVGQGHCHETEATHDEANLWPTGRHFFRQRIDGRFAYFVQPSDTDRPMWGAYSKPEQTPGSFLGTVHVQEGEQARPWRVQSTSERYAGIEDAVRAMRRPPSWHRDRDSARRWARAALDDPALRLLDIQTTGLSPAWAVQIAVLDAAGHTLVDEILDPDAEITAAASALHGITAAAVADAPAFADLFPLLTRALHGQRCVAYGMQFDARVLADELRRHFPTQGPAQHWMAASRWEDAMPAFAAATGLWSARHSAYRWQRLHGAYHAATNCQTLLAQMRALAA